MAASPITSFLQFFSWVKGRKEFFEREAMELTSIVLPAFQEEFIVKALYSSGLVKPDDKTFDIRKNRSGNKAILYIADVKILFAKHLKTDTPRALFILKSNAPNLAPTQPDQTEGDIIS